MTPVTNINIKSDETDTDEDDRELPTGRLSPIAEIYHQNQSENQDHKNDSDTKMKRKQS